MGRNLRRLFDLGAGRELAGGRGGLGLVPVAPIEDRTVTCCGAAVTPRRRGSDASVGRAGGRTAVTLGASDDHGTCHRRHHVREGQVPSRSPGQARAHAPCRTNAWRRFSAPSVSQTGSCCCACCLTGSAASRSASSAQGSSRAWFRSTSGAWSTSDSFTGARRAGATTTASSTPTDSARFSRPLHDWHSSRDLTDPPGKRPVPGFGTQRLARANGEDAGRRRQRCGRGVAAAQVMEGPAYLQKALHLPLRQDVFAEAGILLRARGTRTPLVGYAGHAVAPALIACAYAGSSKPSARSACWSGGCSAESSTSSSTGPSSRRCSPSYPSRRRSGPAGGQQRLAVGSTPRLRLPEVRCPGRPDLPGRAPGLWQRPGDHVPGAAPDLGRLCCLATPPTNALAQTGTTRRTAAVRQRRRRRRQARPFGQRCAEGRITSRPVCHGSPMAGDTRPRTWLSVSTCRNGR